MNNFKIYSLALILNVTFKNLLFWNLRAIVDMIQKSVFIKCCTLDKEKNEHMKQKWDQIFLSNLGVNR